MLRAFQKIQGRGFWASSCSLREFASWPADMSVPEGLKPFDPKGPLSQVDTYMKGVPETDELAQAVGLYKNLRVAVEKLASEQKLAGPSLPKGLATLPNGEIDADFYTETQGIHSDFVTGLKSVMAEELAKQPTPKQVNPWADAWKALEPYAAETEQTILKELDELRKKERQLQDTEERLDDLTVDEVLDMYPQLAKEIKEEIEAGEYDRTNAGHKLETASA